jgi:hypothetical protein
MDPELVKALSFSQKLLSVAIGIAGAALDRIELNDQSREPKIVGLTILCRSISNFHASVLLVQLDQALEAKALVFRSNQMIHSPRLRPRPAAVSSGSTVNHVFDPEH